MAPMLKSASIDQVASDADILNANLFNILKAIDQVASDRPDISSAKIYVAFWNGIESPNSERSLR